MPLRLIQSGSAIDRSTSRIAVPAAKNSHSSDFILVKNLSGKSRLSDTRGSSSLAFGAITLTGLFNPVSLSCYEILRLTHNEIMASIPMKFESSAPRLLT